MKRLRSLARRAFPVLALAMLLCAGARAQGAAAPEAGLAEARIKAAFICKFGNYVKWPNGSAHSGRPFVIGVVASDALFDELVGAAQGHTVGGRPIAVRRHVRGDSFDDLDLLFVGRAGSTLLAEILDATRGQPILTVTEGGGPGGIVNFVVVDDKVRFDIALDSAEQSSLKISGRLLAVARKVSGRPS